MEKKISIAKYLFAFMCCLFSVLVFAQESINEEDPDSIKTLEKKALPEPLTLKYALSLYKESSNPNLRLAQAELVSVSAEKLLIDAKNGFQVDAYASLVAVKPSSVLPDDYSDRNNDHEVGINISKRLYDFGINQ